MIVISFSFSSLSSRSVPYDSGYNGLYRKIIHKGLDGGPPPWANQPFALGGPLMLTSAEINVNHVSTLGVNNNQYVYRRR